jgi:hypothetical protein
LPQVVAMNSNLSDYNEIDFSPPTPPIEMVASFVAESSIVRVIVQGSGGPENTEITGAGLRFIRHILAVTSLTRQGFLPNFKDMNAIRELACQFIACAGGSAVALQTMYSIMQEKY